MLAKVTQVSDVAHGPLVLFGFMLKIRMDCEKVI
jgi:hypothetical protein